jgi:hypothetical protein
VYVVAFHILIKSAFVGESILNVIKNARYNNNKKCTTEPFDHFLTYFPVPPRSC